MTMAIHFNFFLLFMMIGSFIMQYSIMSLIMTNDKENIQPSLGKIYISSIMAFIMGILEVFMHTFMSASKHSYSYYLSYYIPLFSLLALFLWLYKKQIGITDNQYLKEMIEHHSMALLTSKEILKKTKNPQVKDLATKIIKTQEKEIQLMNKMIS